MAKEQKTRFTPEKYGLNPQNPDHAALLQRAAGDLTLMILEVELDYLEKSRDQGKMPQEDYLAYSLEAVHKSDRRREDLGLPPIPDIPSSSE